MTWRSRRFSAFIGKFSNNRFEEGSDIGIICEVEATLSFCFHLQLGLPGANTAIFLVHSFTIVDVGSVHLTVVLFEHEQYKFAVY